MIVMNDINTKEMLTSISDTILKERGIFVTKDVFKNVGDEIYRHLNRPVVVSMNLKNFRYFNLIYGEKNGDILIEMMSDFFIKKTEGCVMGGFTYIDHLIMVYEMPGLDEEAIKKRILEMTDGFLKTVESKFDLVRVHVDCGVCIVEGTETSFYDLQENARFARRSIHETYQSTVAVYSPEMREKTVVEAGIIPSFEWAIKNNGIKIYLQPKFNVETGEYVGAELLTRIYMADGRMLRPDIYIPILERSGLVAKLDSFALDSIIEHMKVWKEKGCDIKTISINLSRIELLDDYFVEELDKKIVESGLDKQYFEFELTETAFCESLGKVCECIVKLHNEGYRISMDDFGSGYNSLYLINTIPLDLVKFDRGFVVHSIGDERGRKVMGGMVNIFDSMDLEVLCEGVETEQDEELVKRCGCNIVQGFLYDMPLPVEEFEEKYIFNDPEKRFGRSR